MLNLILILIFFICFLKKYLIKKNRVRQENLPKSVLEMIWKEIDTQDRLDRVMMIIENCVVSIVSVGGKTVQQTETSSIMLEDYVLNTLLISREEWVQTTTPLISKQVNLAHLQSLLMFFEEHMSGSQVNNISIKTEFQMQLAGKLSKLIHCFSDHLFVVYID